MTPADLNSKDEIKKFVTDGWNKNKSIFMMVQEAFNLGKLEVLKEWRLIFCLNQMKIHLLIISNHLKKINAIEKEMKE